MADATSPRAALDGRRSAPSPTPAGDGTSPIPGRDPSPIPRGDALALGAVADAGGRQDVAAVPERRCLWCRGPLEQTQLRWCSKTCRQTAWRARKLVVIEDLGDTPKRLAYADPPYPGLARRYYGDQPNYAGEVDHAALIAQLVGYDGWALSTSAKALRDVLPLCPPAARVAAWVKPNGAAPLTRGAHNLWEPVIYCPARRRRPGVRDFLEAKPARGGGTLPGRKPIKFCMWVFELLGAAPSDTLDDLFPGTCVVSRAFGQLRGVSAAGVRRG